MPLTSGTLLGPYEILDPIGAGGMGEVYRARDRRLDRVVAIKVLPPHLSADPDLRERFEREARAVSSLNHPHICALYDIGEADVPSHQPPATSHPPSATSHLQYLVMELLEGQTLAARLQKGALPIDEALRFAIEIGGALDTAHRRGIVHRDLKPGNVMLTATGTKLLDFGLAKTGAMSPLKPAVSGPAPAYGPTAVPTSPPLTMAGTILGTLQYMSPEQLEGKDADARTDIFAFGALVHEMVTGRRAFDGKSQVGLIAAIVEHDPPPISSLQPVAPPLLDHLVTTCLAKDPEQRWQTIADVLIQLKLIAERGGQFGAPAAAPAAKAPSRLAWATAAVLAVACAGLGTMAIIGRRQPETAKVTFELNMPTTSSPLHIALSPDGTRLVAPMTSDKGQMLWMRAFEHVNPQVMPGTDGTSGTGGGAFPFWSPDGRFVGFFAGGKLKKVDVFGAPPQTLCDAPNAHGGTWSRGGVIVFAPTDSGPLFRVSAAGGVPARLTELDAGRQETAHRHPAFLPDGKHFLYVAASAKAENTAIVVGSLDSKERKRIVSSSAKAAFAPPGHLLFMRENTLMTQRFDTTRLELEGDPFPVAEQVGVNLGNSAAGFAVSDNGALAYRTGNVLGDSRLLWLDRAGKEVATIGVPAAYRDPALAPDLQHIAVDKEETTSVRDIWIIDEVRGTTSRFTFDPADDRAPLWSPDGKWIVFASNRDGGTLNLYQKNSGGVGTEDVLLKSDHPKLPEDWSADGRFLLYRDSDPKTGSDLWVLPMTGDRKPQPVLRTQFTEQQGRFSPDGRWIAYVSNESAANQVYVQSFPISGTKYQISTTGGVQPRWRKDGRELFFVSTASEAMGVEIAVSKEGTFHAGVPKPLFRVILQAVIRERNSWDAAPDGQRFLINSQSQADSTLRPITIVLNWLAGARASQ